KDARRARRERSAAIRLSGGDCQSRGIVSACSQRRCIVSHRRTPLSARRRRFCYHRRNALAAIDESLRSLTDRALAELGQVTDEAALETWRTVYLSRRGALAEHMRSIGQLSAEERPAAGQAANQAKNSLESAFAAREQQLGELALDRRLAAERLDVTMPARPLHTGGLHPITQTLRRILTIFRD